MDKSRLRNANEVDRELESLWKQILKDRKELESLQSKVDEMDAPSGENHSPNTPPSDQDEWISAPCRKSNKLKQLQLKIAHLEESGTGLQEKLDTAKRTKALLHSAEKLGLPINRLHCEIYAVSKGKIKNVSANRQELEQKYNVKILTESFLMGGNFDGDGKACPIHIVGIKKHVFEALNDIKKIESCITELVKLDFKTRECVERALSNVSNLGDVQVVWETAKPPVSNQKTPMHQKVANARTLQLVGPAKSVQENLTWINSFKLGFAEVLFPSEFCGRLVGIKGANIKNLKLETNTVIELQKSALASTANSANTPANNANTPANNANVPANSASVPANTVIKIHGRQEDVDKCVDKIECIKKECCIGNSDIEISFLMWMHLREQNANNKWDANLLHQFLTSRSENLVELKNYDILMKNGVATLSRPAINLVGPIFSIETVRSRLQSLETDMKLTSREYLIKNSNVVKVLISSRGHVLMNLQRTFAAHLTLEVFPIPSAASSAEFAGVLVARAKNREDIEKFDQFMSSRLRTMEKTWEKKDIKFARKFDAQLFNNQRIPFILQKWVARKFDENPDIAIQLRLSNSSASIYGPEKILTDLEALILRVAREGDSGMGLFNVSVPKLMSPEEASVVVEKLRTEFVHQLFLEFDRDQSLLRCSHLCFQSSKCIKKGDCAKFDEIIERINQVLDEQVVRRTIRVSLPLSGFPFEALRAIAETACEQLDIKFISCEHCEHDIDDREHCEQEMLEVTVSSNSETLSRLQGEMIATVRKAENLATDTLPLTKGIIARHIDDVVRSIREKERDIKFSFTERHELLMQGPLLPLSLSLERVDHILLFFFENLAGVQVIPRCIIPEMKEILLSLPEKVGARSLRQGEIGEEKRGEEKEKWVNCFVVDRCELMPPLVRWVATDRTLGRAFAEVLGVEIERCIKNYNSAEEKIDVRNLDYLTFLDQTLMQRWERETGTKIETAANSTIVRVTGCSQQVETVKNRVIKLLKNNNCNDFFSPVSSIPLSNDSLTSSPLSSPSSPSSPSLRPQCEQAPETSIETAITISPITPVETPLPITPPEAELPLPPPETELLIASSETANETANDIPSNANETANTKKSGTVLKPFNKRPMTSRLYPNSYSNKTRSQGNASPSPSPISPISPLPSTSPTPSPSATFAPNNYNSHKNFYHQKNNYYHQKNNFYYREQRERDCEHEKFAANIVKKFNHIHQKKENIQ